MFGATKSLDVKNEIISKIFFSFLTDFYFESESQF